MARIEVTGACVDLPIYHGRSRSFRTAVAQRTIGGRLSAEHGTVIVNALRNIDLDLSEGDRVALIGQNGAGKTTLLRLLAGIYPPTKGSVRIEGSVSALTDVTMGIDDEATGYENILIRGILMGMKRRDAKALTDDIRTFTELGQYLALPVRTYSTGMRLRLAFALTTCIRPDILLIDEMIGVGDAEFLSRAQARLENMIRDASIFVLASHMPDLLLRFCSRAVWLDKGAVVRDGPIRDVLDVYQRARSLQIIATG